MIMEMIRMITRDNKDIPADNPFSFKADNRSFFNRAVNSSAEILSNRAVISSSISISRACCKYDALFARMAMDVAC